MEQILAAGRARNEPPFVLVLDSLEDPQNFGTMLRSAEAVGVHGVFYPTRRSAPLSPSAIKASAGATEHLLLSAEEDLAATLADLHGRGLRIVAAEEDAAMDYSEADLRGPLAIVVGSEGRGISAAVRRRIDVSVRIPMRGKIASLNAAVAGSVLLFAAAQQRPASVVAESPAKEESLEPRLQAPQEPDKPKRTRKPKPEPAVATEEPATQEPEAEPAKAKRTRKPKTDARAEPVEDAAEPAKPKRTRKEKADAAPASEEPAATEPAKPKRTRKPKTGAPPHDDDLLPGDIPAD
jgi:tRNA(Leu) C34 or U34 (ribose-2'-O)-methylase TrmL